VDETPFTLFFREINMKRRTVSGALFLFATLGFGLPAAAQEYPTRPIRLVVPYLAGAATDTLARVVATSLSKRLGQPVIVDNRAGANSQIGIEYTVNSPPDGYTLVFGANDGLSLLPAVKPSIKYAVPQDFTYLARVAKLPYVVVVNSQLPVKTMDELIKYARSNPDKVTYGTTGIGSITHIGHKLLESKTGVKLVHVPYKGMAAVLTDLLGGHVNMAMISPGTLAAHAGSSSIRMLGIASNQRNPLVPQVPTLSELKINGVEADTWYGIAAPAGLPAPVASRLSREIEAVLNEPAVRQEFTKKGIEPSYQSGKDFEQFIVNDYKRWKALADSARISIED
jgi:tripartite-type tricarboxylate transporter receptor subunit TctC